MKSPAVTCLILCKHASLLWLLATSQVLYANNEDITEEPPVVDILKPLDEPRDEFSRQVLGFANWLDSFFGENRIYEETRGNYLKLRLINTIEEGGSPNYDLKVKAKINLPRTENRLKLLIINEPDEDRVENKRDIPLEVLEAQDPAIALQYTPESTSKWRNSTDAGIRLRSTPDAFLRLRTQRPFEHGNWTLRPTQSLYWFRSVGTGETTQLDIERELGSKYLFRATSAATWLHQNRYFDLAQEFSLFHDLDKRRAVVYQVGVNGISQPDPHKTNYGVSVRLRKQIHRDWLFFEINPRINYTEDNGFNAVKSLRLELEAIFGKY